MREKHRFLKRVLLGTLLFGSIFSAVFALDGPLYAAIPGGFTTAFLMMLIWIGMEEI